MEVANEILGLLTSVVVLATAVVKLYIKSAEQKRLSEKKEGPAEEAADPSTHNGAAR